MKTVYFDNAATTAVETQVFTAMKPYFSKLYGNASEPHRMGVDARKAIETARKRIAEFFGCQRGEIIFTSCATESINLAHKGLIEAVRLNNPKQKPHLITTKMSHSVPLVETMSHSVPLVGTVKPHIITTTIEHKAVLETTNHLKNLGMADISVVGVNRFGVVDVQDIIKAVTDQTVLVSVMYVNNEVGTIEPIAEIGQVLKTINLKRAKLRLPKIYFHTDATQAVQYLNCRIADLGVDLLSFTGHKLGAPKGIGALYIKKGIPITSQQDGGGQEMRLRAGTENVPYIVGLGVAVDLINLKQKNNTAYVLKLRDRLTKGILKLPGVSLTGHPNQAAAHIVSLVISGVEGEAVELLLSERGIIVSTGSACTSGNLQPSHVLTAMGIPAEESHGSLRISLGIHNTLAEVDYLLEILPKIINRLRKMAPDLQLNHGQYL